MSVDATQDPRTEPGMLITNGRHMWEVTGYPNDDGTCPAVNQRTGCPIALTVDTIAGCWPLIPDAHFDTLTAEPTGPASAA